MWRLAVIDCKVGSEEIRAAEIGIKKLCKKRKEKGSIEKQGAGGLRRKSLFKEEVLIIHSIRCLLVHMQIMNTIG